MRRYFSSSVIIGVVALCACADSKSSSADSTAATNATEGSTASAATEVDTTAATPSPSTNPPTGATPPATTRETTREANPTTRPPQRGDPMPPMAGETNSRHGPMTPADTLLRDSASGPRFRINSKGQVTPIKK